MLKESLVALSLVTFAAGAALAPAALADDAAPAAECTEGEDCPCAPADAATE